MDELNVITNLISSIGFPIAACIFLAFENRASREAHEDEVIKMTEALHQNTLAITRLADKMEDLK